MHAGLRQQHGDLPVSACERVVGGRVCGVVSVCLAGPLQAHVYFRSTVALRLRRWQWNVHMPGHTLPVPTGVTTGPSEAMRVVRLHVAAGGVVWAASACSRMRRVGHLVWALALVFDWLVLRGRLRADC